MPKREYQSPLRRQQTEDTKRRIREAAAGLFSDVGFGSATVARIAEQAGVSQATVYSNFESKAGIVAAMLEEMEEAAGMPQRIEAMLAESDPRMALSLFVEGNRTVFEMGHGLLRVAVGAKADPAVDALMRAGDANRRIGTDTMVGVWHRAGALRAGLSRERASQSMWLLTSVEQYLTATDLLGWTPAKYEGWLGELLGRELLEP